MQVKLGSIVYNALTIGSCIIGFQQFVSLWSITLTVRVRLLLRLDSLLLSFKSTSVVKAAGLI